MKCSIILGMVFQNHFILWASEPRDRHPIPGQRTPCRPARRYGEPPRRAPSQVVHVAVAKTCGPLARAQVCMSPNGVDVAEEVRPRFYISPRHDFVLAAIAAGCELREGELTELVMRMYFVMLDHYSYKECKP